MTTKLELAEILIGAEETGRKIQELMGKDGCQWHEYDGDNFNLKSCEYRLAPKKKVKHSGWFSEYFLEDSVNNHVFPSEDDVFVEWETEE